MRHNIVSVSILLYPHWDLICSRWVSCSTFHHLLKFMKIIVRHSAFYLGSLSSCHCLLHEFFKRNRVQQVPICQVSNDQKKNSEIHSVLYGTYSILTEAFRSNISFLYQTVKNFRLDENQMWRLSYLKCKI